MRKVLVSIAALGAALAAAPSMAQSYGYPGGGYGQPGYGYDNGYNNGRYTVPSARQVSDMVERAIQTRQVSWREARELREDVRDLFRLEQKSRYGNDWGAREKLQRKTFEVLRELREARRDDGRDGRWGDRERDNDYRYR